jgi:hypothetical protein
VPAIQAGAAQRGWSERFCWSMPSLESQGFLSGPARFHDFVTRLVTRGRQLAPSIPYPCPVAGRLRRRGPALSPGLRDAPGWVALSGPPTTLAAGKGKGVHRSSGHLKPAALRSEPGLGGRNWLAPAWGALPQPQAPAPHLPPCVGECRLPNLGGRDGLAQPHVAATPRPLVEMAQEAPPVALI